ncbi:TPA: hypothetical protein WH481_001584 [Neisseria meningitidis]
MENPTAPPTGQSGTNSITLGLKRTDSRRQHNLTTSKTPPENAETADAV